MAMEVFRNKIDAAIVISTGTKKVKLSNKNRKFKIIYYLRVGYLNKN